MSDLTVANTIADQLGNGFFRMMGTTSKIGDEKSLTFDIKLCKKYNKIKITLDLNDLYTVDFIKVGRAQSYKQVIKHGSKPPKEVTDTHEGIYVEMLHELIERETGLAVRVPRIRGINC